MRLGKALPKIDARTLRLSDYLGDMSKAPSVMVWADRRYSMLGNDKIGNCTCVTAHHAVQTWQASSGDTVQRPKAADAIKTYQTFAGYDGTAATDNGANMLDVLRAWRKIGLSTGHKINSFATVDDDAWSSLKECCWLFGGLPLGIALPVFATTALDWEKPKRTNTKDTKPYGAGGHAVLMAGYDETHATIVTWGRRIRASWDFLETYCDEAYAALSDDWMNKDDKPFNRAKFDTDLAAVVSTRTGK